MTDGYWDNVGVIDYYWTHAMISDHTYHQLKKLCNFSDPNCCSNSCINVYNYATITEIGIIDPYSINTPACTEVVGGGSPQKKKFLSFRPNNPVESSSPQHHHHHHHHHHHTSQLFVIFKSIKVKYCTINPFFRDCTRSSGCNLEGKTFRSNKMMG